MMETIEYKTIDRTGWPFGPWDFEPDKVQWPDHNTGLPCLAVRHPHAGHWCGYVGIAPEHPLHGKDYDDFDLTVHGGLTFSDSCQTERPESESVCHIPEDGEPDHVWWFGFDCAHCNDCSPLDHKYAEERGYPFTIRAEETYRTLDYVKRECAELARQLAAYDALVAREETE